MLVKDHITVVLNKPALSPVAIQSLGNGCVVKDVVFAQLGLQMLCGFDSVVEWHLREHVMALVGVANVMVKVVDDRAEGAVDSAGGTSLEVPLVVTEVGHLGVGVLKVSDADNPSIHAKVRDSVVHENSQWREDHRQIGKNRSHDDNAAVGVEDVLGLVGLEERSHGLEVVDPVRGVVTREVDEKIQWPSEGEDKEEGAQRVQRGFSKDRLVVVLVVRLILGSKALVRAGSRDKDNVLGHRSSALVMLGVGHLPGLVGDQEGGVENPAKDGVDSLAIREGAMSTL